MQVLTQLVTLYFSIVVWKIGLFSLLGQIEIVCGTVLSLILTIVAIFRHGDIRRFKTGLPRFTKSKYLWLNITSLIVLTGLPVIALERLAFFISQGLNLTVWITFANITLNAPGIIYFVLASSFFPKRKFRFKLPKYL